MANFNVDMNYLHQRKSLEPYKYLSVDLMKTLTNGDQYRIIVYGAYNAMGLVGTEKNGIAILDQQRMAVLSDEISPAPSGYDTPSTNQINLVQALMDLSDDDFKTFVNKQRHTRYTI